MNLTGHSPDVCKCKWWCGIPARWVIVGISCHDLVLNYSFYKSRSGLGQALDRQSSQLNMANGEIFRTKMAFIAFFLVSTQATDPGIRLGTPDEDLQYGKSSHFWPSRDSKLGFVLVMSPISVFLIAFYILHVTIRIVQFFCSPLAVIMVGKSNLVLCCFITSWIVRTKDYFPGFCWLCWYLKALHVSKTKTQKRRPEDRRPTGLKRRPAGLKRRPTGLKPFFFSGKDYTLS